MPPLVKNPDALMERAVELRPDGLTHQELSDAFTPLGQDQFNAGRRAMLDRGRVRKSYALLPNKFGVNSRQVVYRVNH